MLLATVMFAFMHAAIRHATQHMPPAEVAFFRNLFGLFVVAPLLMRYGIGLFYTQKLHLHVLRAGIQYQAGDLPAADAAARKAIAEDPTLEDAYWQVATFSLDTRKYDTTVEMLDLLQKRFGVELEDLTKVPEYAEFVKSPQYRIWSQTQKR